MKIPSLNLFIILYNTKSALALIWMNKRLPGLFGCLVCSRIFCSIKLHKLATDFHLLSNACHCTIKLRNTDFIPLVNIDVRLIFLIYFLYLAFDYSIPVNIYQSKF